MGWIPDQIRMAALQEGDNRACAHEHPAPIPTLPSPREVVHPTGERLETYALSTPWAFPPPPKVPA